MGCEISSARAPERGVYVVQAAFTDENGVAVIPKSVAWTLTDPEGVVINSRSAVPLTPAVTVLVVMKGDDLDRSDGPTRVLLVEAVYDSVMLGTDIPLKAEFWYEVQELVAVS